MNDVYDFEFVFVVCFVVFVVDVVFVCDDFFFVVCFVFVSSSRFGDVFVRRASLLFF